MLRAVAGGLYLKSFPSRVRGRSSQGGRIPCTGSKPSTMRTKHHAGTLWHEREFVVHLSSPKPIPKQRLALLPCMKMTHEILTKD